MCHIPVLNLTLFRARVLLIIYARKTLCNMDLICQESHSVYLMSVYQTNF